MHVIEHHIQREIIDRLMRAESLRFKELKPDGMESNIFMYHLKRLIKEGYIAKVEAGYTLAFKGLAYVDNVNTTNRKPQSQPKIVAIIVVQDAAGRFLMVQRKTQPFINTHMLISGRQHRGETVEEHAHRELNEKLGINASHIYRGQAEILLYDLPSKQLLTHIVGQVYEVTVTADMSLPAETDYFRFEWIDAPEADTRLMPGTKELIQKLESAKNLIAFSYSNIA